MDRISELPQLIIHQIFSYLDTKEAARTSVLSKTWLEVWSTSPILVLDEPPNSNNNYNEDNKQNFFGFVATTLLRYRTQNLRIDKLTILQHGGKPFPHSLLDQSMEIILHHHVKHLVINVAKHSVPYTLPKTICANFDLRHVELYGMFVSDNFFNQLVSNSPHLEYVRIRFCHMLEKINVSGRSLKHVIMQYCDNLVEAKIIDVPNLVTLVYMGTKVLSLSLVDSINWDELRTCITINCDHDGRSWPGIKLFRQLRKLLKETISRSSINVWLRLRVKEMEFDSDLNPFANPLPRDLLADMNDHSCDTFFERLFSLCRPTIIVADRSLRCSRSNEFMKLLFFELRKGIPSNCCSSNLGNKCWRHYLKNIKVEGCPDSEHVAAWEWEHLPMETLLGKYIYDSRRLLKIRFEWMQV